MNSLEKKQNNGFCYLDFVILLYCYLKIQESIFVVYVFSQSTNLQAKIFLYLKLKGNEL